MERAHSTVHGYLVAYIRESHVCDPNRWVDATTATHIEQAAEQTGIERLKPIFDKLEGAVDFDTIRIVVECLKNRSNDTV